MAANEVSVATAALAIAIVALLIALGQLIQQLFGTADGYRRCQSSVIGGWSKLVQLRFRWSSFRLEVRVTTPHFEIRPYDAYVLQGAQIVALTGSSPDRRRTFTRARSASNLDDYDDEDVVSWTKLLTALHDGQQLQLSNMNRASLFLEKHSFFGRPNLGEVDCIDSLSSIVFAISKTRSWDLMPPDVVRPLASTSLGTLISIAHRMGMVWMDFIPRDGRIRAEGLGQSLSATLMRGMGIVVEYNTEPGSQTNSTREIFQSLHVPSTAADKMALGIIPGNGLFHTWDLRLRSDDNDPDTELIVQSILDILSGSKHANLAVNAVRNSVKHQKLGHHWPAFVDILGLWSEWIPLHGSPINTVISPIGHRVFTMGEVYEARVVWRWLLREREKHGRLSIIQTRLLGFYDSWEQKDPHLYNHYYWLPTNDPKQMTERDFFKQMYDETTAFFMDQGAENPMYYVTLVGAHISVNAHSLKEADDNVKAGKSRNDGRTGQNLWDTLFTERAFIYVDNIPKIVDDMDVRCNGKCDSDSVEDAWWMLMVRMQCWEMGVNRVVQKSCVPSSYYNSPTRVYIL